MDKWKIAIYLCLYVVALSQLSHAETKAYIPGDELEGPNVCKRIISHNVTVVVSELVPYQESKMEWCAQFPPRCRKTVIKLKSVNKTEVLEKTQAIRECCDGYIENEQKNRCIPYCQQPCGDHGACVSPNNCKCDSGYGGPSCDITCPPGRYGKNCNKKCDCTNGAECDPYDGTCHCKRGFQGKKCENTCSPDTYGEKCQEKCRCVNGGACNHISGECYCKKGFTGPLCEETCKNGKNGDECKSICRCQNGGICNDDLSCTCPLGWLGTVCANRCQPGFFGLNCSQVCECFNGASCDHVTGACICEPGFMGEKCLDQCPFNKYGVNCTQECICSNGATCDKGTGFCHCIAGWTGDDCSERLCEDNKYGESCNETCECEKENTELCHPNDGTCECKEGFTGANCNRPCPFLKYGKSCAYQCDCKNNAQCQPTNGKCICLPGFTGEKCESSCPDGSYGQDCSQRCECKNGAKCSPETGECFCKPGWQGLKCERPCEVNTYGPGCSLKCDCLNNGACNPVTGECHCSVGWIGTHCENKCDPWTFGFNCSFECNCERQNSLACDHQSGRCLCRTEYRGSQTIKYTGVKCESTCPLGYYGQECQHQCNCKNNSSCDPVTGECFCDRGWMGRTCDEKCPNGYFGQNCKEKCPENMPPKTTCDHVTGDYKCRPGYIGLTCDHACSRGTYGEDCKYDCKCEQGECHHVDGVCRCYPGWWGDYCETACPEDTWGINCQHKCQCANDAQCRKSDGICICKAGFMGPKCEEVCPEGFYGSNCLEVCTCNRKPNFVCHPSHGCVCKAGWRGKNCDESIYSASTAEPEEVNRSGMIWAIFCTFLFLGIIGMLLLYYRRRVANLKAEIGHVVRYMSDDPGRNFDNPVYSYQPSVNTDTSTLLHRHGMNNLRQTRPMNIALNNFDQDSNSSGRAAQYSLQYDAELMNQKNHEADQTNPNFYSSIDDHLYDEIKLKCADLDMEYDHLDYSRPQQPIVPHYHRATSSTMSTLSQRNRESDQSNNTFTSNLDSTYDAPVPHPKKLNISVPPELPAKNINANLTPSPSSSTASTVTQDDNIDAIISIEKPMNKDLNSKPDVMTQQTDN